MRVRQVDISALRIPTEGPEADGTFAWDTTTMVVVEAIAEDGQRGFGFSYTAASAGNLVREMLADEVVGRSVRDVRGAWEAMVRKVRNVGLPGLAATAISAVDVALWDLHGRVAGQSLGQMLGQRRSSVPVYGSGGFTTYSDQQLRDQFLGWLEQGVGRVKMKVGTDRGTRTQLDVHRVAAARDAVGPDVELMVDANGAFTAPQAIAFAETVAGFGVTYFEEPVSSDHLEQLSFVRHRLPAGMALAAGEYGYTPWYFRDMLRAGAVDILQADVTRCLGITGWLEVAVLAHSFAIPFSAHCAPALHAPIACAAPEIAHVEYFHDHVRIERMLFDGVAELKDGHLHPDQSRPGLGLELKRADAAPYLIA